MKLSRNNRRSCAAATLIECLIYIGVFATLLGVSMSAFYHCYDHMRSLRRNADDITRALHLGELWRQDVRLAIRQPAQDETDQTLHIPQKDGVVGYRFTDNQVLRRTSATAPWSSVLTNLNQSQIRLGHQNGVAIWRWELELKSLRKPARVQPLFTFTAVPESAIAP
jgi:hypothetical protein